MSRIFHVRLNLDAVSADLNTLVDDAERGEWLRGFMSGASGGVNRFVDSSPAYLGWYNGAAARGHAEDFHDKQAAHGAKSAKVRVEKYGTAQPSKVDRTTLEGGSNDPRTTPEGIPNLSNNPIIQESNKPVNEESISVAKAPKVRKQKLPDSPEVECFKRHAFRIKGTTVDKRSALTEAIRLLGISEADKQLPLIGTSWASDLLAKIVAPQPAAVRRQAPPINLDFT